VTTPSAAKGNAFEGQVIVPYLRDQFGPHISRPRAGAAHDLGDIAGIPGWTLELKNYTDLMRAVRDGLADLDVEQANAGTRYGAVIVKRRGKTDPGEQLFVMRLRDAIEVIRETAHWEALAGEGAA
jgi:hypothetical protein